VTGLHLIPEEKAFNVTSAKKWIMSREIVLKQREMMMLDNL